MEKQRIAFIEPHGFAQSTYAVWQRFAPLLGPIYLATIADQAGYETIVLNENVLGREILDDELLWADQICVSCMTATVTRGKAIAQRYREVRERHKLPAIAHIGGIHASMMPEDVTPYFDHIAIGEGELILLDLLAGNFSEQIVQGIPVEDLDSLPFLNFSLIKGWNPTSKYWPLQTSRGCPFDCDFCSVNHMFGRRYRSQSPERVVEEMRQYQTGYIGFMDDNFSCDLDRTARLLELMERTPEVRRPWNVQIRTDATKYPDMVAQMRAAGCKWVLVGFESIDAEALHDIEKRQDVDDIIRAIRVFHDANIRVHGMFVLGHDAEDGSVFKKTADFATRYNIDTTQYWILTPYPGTRVFQRLEQQERLLHTRWEYYDALHTVFQPNQMSPLELQDGMMTCYKQFYTWPNVFRDTCRTLGKTVDAGFRKLRSQPIHLPSGWSPLIKLGARKLLQNWEQQNTDYRHYLCHLKTTLPKQARISS